MSSEKTSVQVAVRIRPITSEDLINLPTRFQKSVLSTAPYAPNQVIVASEKKQYFSYDYVFGPETTQKDIYDKAVLKLIDKFLEGYNVTILAYGQTSSGKTFTMGTSDNDLIEPEEKGIIPRAVSTLFSSMDSAQYKTRKFSIKVSFIEIYNEDLIDLLGEGEGESRPQVLIREDSKGNILWSGLQEIKVNNVEEVIAHLKRGSLSRQTGATDMNSQSSRSHAIFSVTLAQQRFVPASGSPQPNDSQQKSGVRSPSRSGSRLSRRFDEGEWISVTSKFHFVDLAGSERLKRTSAMGDRVKEGISINSGLLALGNVISALGDPNKAKHTTHVPYRDSKLTRLLQDSLGGNAQTLMIACVSPAEYNLTETVNTLKYANRARNIKNNATINAEEAGWNDLEHLQTLVMKLRNEIKTLKSASGVVNSNVTYTNGTSSGRSTPITPTVNGRETPSHIKRSSTPSNLPQSLSGRETPSHIKRPSTPSNLPQSLSGRETPSHVKRPSTPSSLPIVSQQPPKSQNHNVESLEDQLKQLKYSYVKLSQRYAKTSAELAKHQDNDDGSNSSGTDSSAGDRNSLSVIKEVDDEKFQEVVEPVIEEYEKSFSLLESQFAITKAALSHSELTIKEQQTKLELAEQSNEQNKNLISELKNKIAKLTESESTMERYIKDLEIKLEELSSDQKRDQDLINELKSEISQMKANGNNSEGYIQDLESKLCTSEGQSVKLSETIAKLEKRLQQRETAYFELEERLSRAEVDEEKGLLLSELDNREKRILILEQNVESFMNELEELKKLKEYEDFSLSRDASGLTSTFGRSITPVNDNDTTLIATLESRLSDLQKTHEKTLQEFENIKSKYQSCLLEIHDLQGQLTEAKLIHSETVKSTPTTPMSPQSPGLGNSFRLSLPPLNEVNESLNVNNNLTLSKHKRSKSFSTEIYGSDKKDGAHLAVIQSLKNEIQQLSSLHEDKTQGLDAVKQEFARLEISYRGTLDIVEELREELKRRDALAQLEVMSVMTTEHVDRSYHSVNHSEVDELEIVQRLREEVEQLKEEQRITMESLSERERESLKGHDEVLKIESSIQELREELRHVLEKSKDDKSVDAKNDERINELQSRVKELEQELVKAQESQKQEQIDDAAARLEGSTDSSETGRNNDSSSNEENLALRRQVEKLQLDIESKSHTIATLLLPTAEHQNTIRRLEDELQEIREAMKDKHNKLVIISEVVEDGSNSQFIEPEEEQNVEEIVRELEAKAKDLEAQLIKAKEAQHIPTPRNSFLQMVDPTQRDIIKLQDKLSDLQKELALKSETIQNLESEKELVVSLQSQLEILKNDINRKYELVEVLKRDLADKGILQQKLREKEAEATALQSQLLTVKKRDTEMQNQMEALQSQLLKLEGGDSSLHKELENVRKELKETKENEKFSIERLRILNAEESKLQQELQRLRQGDIAQKERINVLESKLSQESPVVEDLAALRAELSLAKEVETTQQQKISELENKLKGSETEVSTLQSKIVEMKSKSTSDDSQIQNLVSDINDLRVLENEQKQSIETLENKLKQDELVIVNMKDELAELKETESQLRSTIQELEDKLAKAEKENEKIQMVEDEINLLKELCTEQNSKIEQLHSELEETQSAKETAIRELEIQKEDFATQKELVIRLESELKDVREELVKANEKITDNDKKLEELSNALFDTKKQQDEEEGKKKLLENEVEALKSAGETSNKDVNDLRTELTTLKMEKEARNKRLSEIENQIHIAEKERDQHLERINELTKMVDTKEAEKKEAVSVLENKVSDLQSQLEQVKESSRVDQETIENLEEKFAILSSQLEVAKESNEKYTQIISELETKLKESNALLSEKEQSLSDKNSKYVELEAIIEKARAELEDSKASEVANNNQIKQLGIDLQESEMHKNQQSELIYALESQLQEAEDQRGDQISKLAEANAEIEILREKCSSIQSKINEVHDDSLLHGYSKVDENAVEELSKELKKFQEESQVQQEHADILQMKVDKLQSEKNHQLVINADLAQQVEQLQKDLESLAEEFSETVTKQEDNEIQMKDRISELETALEETEKDVSNPYLAKLADANENLRQTNYDLNSKIAEAEQRASSLSEKIKTLESELECTKSASNSLKAKVQELEAEKRVLDQANESSFEERQKLDQRIESLIQQLQTSGRNGNKTATHLAELNTKILSLEKEIFQAKQKAKEDNSEILKLKEINERLEQEFNEDTIRDSGHSLDSGYISQASTPRTLKKIDSPTSPTQFKFYRQESTIAQQNNLIRTLQDKINELERQAEENLSRSGTPIAADLDAVGGYRATSPKSAVRPPPTPPPNQPLPRVPPSPGAPPISPPPRIPLPPKPDSSPDLTVEKLNKRIAKLEGDNLQNRQLVDTLEASLNDSETNLRVAKQQLQILQREKSDLVNQTKSLKMQLEDAAAQYEHAKSSVQQEKKFIESVLLEERKAKEQAERSKLQLESRMEELINKKSKFMCF